MTKSPHFKVINMEKVEEKLKEAFQKHSSDLPKRALLLVLLIHPKDLTELIREFTFLDVSAYRLKGTLISGEVGRIFGVPVKTSLDVSPGDPIVIPYIPTDINFNPSRRYQNASF